MAVIVPAPARPAFTPRRLAPFAGVAVILAADAVLAFGPPPSTVRFGVLDEIAHETTAVLALAALRPYGGSLAPYALVGAVAIDVDHVPAMLAPRWFGRRPGRPRTHSLATPAALFAGSLLARRAGRPRLALAAQGGAAGVALHFARDIVIGPGVPLAFPVRRREFRAPYQLYAAGLVAAAWLAARR